MPDLVDYADLQFMEVRVGEPYFKRGTFLKESPTLFIKNFHYLYICQRV